jgi:UDP-glucuronate 4-epimerase
MQPGEVPVTFADIEPLHALTGYRPTTTIETGIGMFADWLRPRMG